MKIIYLKKSKQWFSGNGLLIGASRSIYPNSPYPPESCTVPLVVIPEYQGLLVSFQPLPSVFLMLSQCYPKWLVRSKKRLSSTRVTPHSRIDVTFFVISRNCLRNWTDDAFYRTSKNCLIHHNYSLFLVTASRDVALSFAHSLIEQIEPNYKGRVLI